MIPPKPWPYRKPASVAVSPSGGDTIPGTNSNPDLLTTGEAAHVLRLSPRTLERFRVEGTGPRYIKAGRGKRARVLYRKEDLESWLDGSRFNSTSEYVG